MVPDNFKVPEKMTHERFLMRPLTVRDVVKDYDAVMHSRKRIVGVFGDSWPSPDLTFEQDLIDLGWHQKEFQRRTSFAYTLMAPDESKCIGCVYIFPSPKKQYDAAVFFWVTDEEYARGLDGILSSFLLEWITKWPFKNVAFPGRKTPWKEWNSK